MQGNLTLLRSLLTQDWSNPGMQASQFHGAPMVRFDGLMMLLGLTCRLLMVTQLRLDILEVCPASRYVFQFIIHKLRLKCGGSLLIK